MKAKQVKPASPKGEVKIDPRSGIERQNMLQQSIDILTNSYLAELKDYPMIPFDKNHSPVEAYTRLFPLVELIYANDEDFLQKATTVLYTAYAVDANVVVMLNSDGNSNRYLFGISVPNDEENASYKFDAVHRAMKGNFSINCGDTMPKGQLSNSTLKAELEHVFSSEVRAITTISGIPALRNVDKHSVQSFIQGVENLTQAMQGYAYTLMIQATPVHSMELKALRNSYEGLYTSLSAYAKSDCNYNSSENESTNTNEQFTQGEGTNISDTDTYSESEGYSETETTTSNTSKTVNTGAIVGGLLVAGAAAAVVLTGDLASVPLATAAVATTGVTSGLNAVGNLLGSKTEGLSKSNASTTNKNISTSNSHTNGTSWNTSTTIGTGRQLGTTTGQSIQFSIEDKAVQNTLSLIDDNLERLKKCENYGTFASCAYVISNNMATNASVAALYESLMRGDTSFTQSAQIHTWWENDVAFSQLKNYLSHLEHPLFSAPIGALSVTVSPASLISGEELSVQISLPKKSIPGVTVRNSVEFGCNPPVLNKDECHLGSIYHLGNKFSTPVKLNKGSLSAHTFVTGSTGSGKSNTIYTMLNELQQKDVKFMVVEPAKGEYKEVFGGRKNVTAYGTNPKKTELLRINPFSFPEDIHVLEHIDRLIEIFNACWPMYAAMPAVLKDAVEQSYIKCGWSLTTSTSVSGVFPTFRNLLTELPLVMDQSAYSKDTKGDYVGALVTRVKSLTNGINGQVFCGMDELPNETLFDENIIVDLSRVGSSETKSLIMGLMVMKLQEYRMCQSSMNTELKHVTVLEEAHNLLRRTSSEQSQEGSNLQGKSVEMLANAIAEMRTYGEGFIIADQSPGLLDLSVIRNTNTKILMRLPDQSDRELVGKSIGLNDDQIMELSKLEVGVAAVYQNDWLEAVLCKINYFEDKCQYTYEAPSQPPIDAAREAFLYRLMHRTAEQDTLIQENADSLKLWIGGLDVGSNAKNQLLELIHSPKLSAERNPNKLLYQIVKGKSLCAQAYEFSPEDCATNYMTQEIMDRLQVSNMLANEIQQHILSYVISEFDRNSIESPFAERLKRIGGVSL